MSDLTPPPHTHWNKNPKCEGKYPLMTDTWYQMAPASLSGAKPKQELHPAVRAADENLVTLWHQPPLHGRGSNWAGDSWCAFSPQFGPFQVWGRNRAAPLLQVPFLWSQTNMLSRSPQKVAGGLLLQLLQGQGREKLAWANKTELAKQNQTAPHPGCLGSEALRKACHRAQSSPLPSHTP